MILRSISELKHFLKSGFRKVCILDNNIDNITIYTNDSDAYSINKRSIEKMQEERYYKNIEYRAITFKSDDFLISELYNKFGLQAILDDVHKLRNDRWIRFTRKKSDNSIEERYKLVKNHEFLELIQDNSLYIIF